MKKDQESIDVTKASMQTTITRQQFFDALLSDPKNKTAENIKDTIAKSTKAGEQILVR